MPVLLRRLLILFEDLVDDGQKLLQLPLRPGPLHLTTDRFLVFQNPYQRASSQSVLRTRPPLIQLPRQHLPTNFNPFLHVLENLCSS